MSSQSASVPESFEAFDDTAVYVTAILSRSSAITHARTEHFSVLEDWPRERLRAVKVYMYPVAGEAAQEAFYGEFESGWMEAKPVNSAQRARLTPMWKVEPR